MDNRKVTSIDGNLYFSGLKITSESIKEMRSWLKDLVWADDFLNIEDYSDKYIVKKIQFEFDGGVENFLMAIS